MGKYKSNEAPDAQQKYRQAQANKGLVRYELQISAESKAKFESLVNAAADEYDYPWNQRQRMAKARVQIFDEITQGVLHDFQALQNQIIALKEEVAALSPTFFKSNTPDQTPLPHAIESLPDDPSKLKRLLANFYKTAKQAMTAGQEHKRRAKQFEELYNVSSSYVDELKELLDEKEAF